MQTALVFFVSAWACIAAQGFAPAGHIASKCFDCLCEAASECELEAECASGGAGELECGPYRITHSYWQEAGSPGEDPQDPLAFERCLRSRACSEATIRGYYSRWSRDCDGDGRVDCHDVARLHRQGPHCNDTQPGDAPFWDRFGPCYAEIRRELDGS